MSETLVAALARQRAGVAAQLRRGVPGAAGLRAGRVVLDSGAHQPGHPRTLFDTRTRPAGLAAEPGSLPRARLRRGMRRDVRRPGPGAAAPAIGAGRTAG